MRNDATVIARLPSSIKRALARAAQHQRRTTSSLLVFIMGEWLEARGYLKPPSDRPKRTRKG
jgi:hypothetical protein